MAQTKHRYIAAAIGILLLITAVVIIVVLAILIPRGQKKEREDVSTGAEGQGQEKGGDGQGKGEDGQGKGEDDQGKGGEGQGQGKGEERSTESPTTSGSVPASSFGQYRFAAVTSNHDICSRIGTEIMGRHGGGAVDGAIATEFCIGVAVPQEISVGGGLFMTVYAKPKNGTKKEMSTILSRETAPGSATSDMYVNKPRASIDGGLGVGVPGEVMGLYTAWKEYGSVPWADLIAPSIKLLRDGVTVSKRLAKDIGKMKEYIKNDTNLRVLVHEDGTPLKEGDLYFDPQLVDTLQKIADDPLSIYNGALARDVAADIADYGGIVTVEDLQNYRARIRPPVKVTLANANYDVYSVPPPSSGVIVELILQIMDGYNLTPDSINEKNKAVTYQRIIEAFKFAFAKRSALGDADFVDIKEIVAELSSREFADALRMQINDTVTQPVAYYKPSFEVAKDQGTSQIAVLAPDGAAVSISSTFNWVFGAKIRGNRTGIWFNNEMDDFSTPGTVNAWGFAASPTNFIEPGKMPMSSMSPTIITDQNGNVILVTGASGGSKIITNEVFVAIHNLWLGDGLDAATDRHRIHHQLLPELLYYEPHFDKDFVSELQKFGHNVSELSVEPALGAVNSIRNNCWKVPVCQDIACRGRYCINAVADWRKDGGTDGL